MMCRRLHRSAGMIAVTLLGCAAGVGAQSTDKLYTASHQQLEAVKVVLAQEAAWNKGDLDGYLARFKDDPATEAILAGPVHGLAAIKSAYHINFPSREAMGTIEYSDVEARELGENFALATGKYQLERSKKTGGPAEGTFVEVMEKTPTGWMVIFSETT